MPAVPDRWLGRPENYVEPAPPTPRALEDLTSTWDGRQTTAWGMELKGPFRSLKVWKKSSCSEQFGFKTSSRRLPLIVAAVVLCMVLIFLWRNTDAQAAITHRYLSRLTGFGQVFSVALGGAGEVYVAGENPGTHEREVTRFSSGGVPLPFTCGAECSSYVQGDKLMGTPAGLFRGNIEAVAVNDETKELDLTVEGRPVVYVFSSTGKYEGELTGTCTNRGETPPSCPTFVAFAQPKALAFNQTTHELYVADAPNAVVDVFKPEAGGRVTYVSQFGTSVLSFPVRVAVNELTGDAYVGEEGRVDVFESAGGFLSPPWTGEDTPTKTFEGTQSVAVDPSTHHEYISGGHEVDEFAAPTAEEYVGRLTGTPTGEGGAFVTFPEVGAVAVAPASAPTTGDLYVASGTSSERVVDQFGPDVVIPNVATAAASDVRLGSVVFNGTVNPTAEGGEATCGFEYGTSTSYGKVAECAGPGSRTSPIPRGESPVPVKSEAVSGLALDRTYYYRLDATNTENGETTKGECPQDCGQFVSTGPGLHGESVTGVSATSATLQASINPNKAPENTTATSYYFQYVEAARYEAGAPDPYGAGQMTPGEAIGPAEGDLDIGREVQGLKPNTVYHYRVVVLSEVEVSAGSSEIIALYEPGQTFATEQAGTEFELPDGREWELVSPPDKHGASIYPMLHQGGVIEAAEAGGAITYVADGPVGSNPQGNRALEVSQALSGRRLGGGGGGPPQK
jgi:hypothetical protein